MEKNHSEIISGLLEALPRHVPFHPHDSDFYAALKLAVRKEIERVFDGQKNDTIEFGPFGTLRFPYHKMGAIDSLNLFDLDEIILFSFYWANRNRYKKVLDIGANLGLHSILLSKCGYQVSCYEPDPTHFRILGENLALNNVHNVSMNNKAVSNKVATIEFVRVLGNTTGSHISGAKRNPYGPLERFNVQTEDFRSLISGVDFLKMDIEGHEREVILATTRQDWKNLDAFVEIEGAENAEAVFRHLSSEGVNLISQKRGWREVRQVSDMPASYREGMLFLTCRDQMPWAG